MEQNIVSPTKSDFLKFLHEARSSKVSSKLTKRDIRFALMSELDGWVEFKEMAEKKVDSLRSLRDYESAGKDLAELGLRFLVADLVAGVVEDLIKRVDQAKVLYDEEQKKKN